MSTGTVLLISDVHTHYHVIDAQIAHAEDTAGQPIDQVMVLGDFGFFGDRLHDYFRRKGRRFPRPVAFIEGNHEDHAALPGLAVRYADVVTHRRRGSVHRVGPWNGLCLGGARYMDAWSTPRGCEITEADVAACLAHAPGSVDMVLSHDGPTGIGIPNTPGLEHYGTPGVPEMERLAAHFRPRWWFFGHHHAWFELRREGTHYVGLPQSWVGYVLLNGDGEVVRIDHEVALAGRSAWKRWFGLR